MGQCLQKIRVNAPGSIVLMGEHAVLYGQAALVFAIDKRISLCLTLRKDRLININSSLGQYCGSLDLPMSHPSFSFIITALEYIKPESGFDLEITSEIDCRLGLGSSAAITASITAALLTLQYQKKPPKEEIFKKAYDIVLKTQGKASGIDLAASIYGGLIFYRMSELSEYSIEHVSYNLPIHLVYSGYKTPTSQVLNKISQVEIEYPAIKKINQTIYALMGELSEISLHALRDGNIKLLAQAMNRQQGLLETLGVSDPTLSDIVWRLREQSLVMAAKISGSGLGDCVIALGESRSQFLFYPSIDCSMHSKGIYIAPITSSYSTHLSG